MSTDPLTPEQVKKLRIPYGYEIRDQGAIREPRWYLHYPGERDESPVGDDLGALAVSVANGHLPPEALDAVWAIVEGRVEQITVGSADYYGGPQDVRTIEPEPVDELVTHLLLQVKP